MGLFDVVKKIGKVGSSFIPGGSAAFDLADAGLSAIGAFKGAGQEDAMAQQAFADKMGDLKSQHAQNWWGADDYDYQNNIQRSPRQNWLRSLLGGGGVEGGDNKLSSGLIDLFAPKWSGRNYEDLMAKTDPSQFYSAPERRGFFSKVGDALGAGIGAGISGAREQNRFNTQMDAMRGAYGADRGGAREQGRLDAAQSIASTIPKPELPGGGISRDIASIPAGGGRLASTGYDPKTLRMV